MGERNNPDEYDLEMIAVEDEAYSYDSDDFDTSRNSNTDSEYGEGSLHERTLTPTTVTSDSSAGASAARADFYRTSMKRQNICFGSTVFLVVGMFIAAYFYMDISFSPANVGIFGDEKSMKGFSGEVGLDADNAETQEIIDEEIIELEETGKWGDNAKEARSKIDEIIFDTDRVGEHKWVEDGDWWKNNFENMDTSNMTKEEFKAYKKMKKKEERQKRKKAKQEKMEAKAAKSGKVGKKKKKEGHLEDIDDIKQKLANRHHESHGKEKNKHKNDIDDVYRMKQKHNGPRPDDRPRGKNRDKGSEQNDGGNAEEEQDQTTEAPLDDVGDVPEEEMNAGETNEQVEDTEEDNEGAEGIEGQLEDTGEDNKEADGMEDQEDASEIQKDTRNYDVDGDIPKEDANGVETDEQIEDTEEGKDGGDGEEEQEETTEVHLDNVGDIPEDGIDTAETNEQLVDAEEENEEAEDTAAEDEETTFDGELPTEEDTNEAEINELVVEAEVNEEELAVPTISTAYTVLEQDTHDSMSFTQGISYCSDGKIYETTGLYGQSKVRRINPDTFEVEKSIDTPSEFFGEGSTCFIGRDGKEYLIEITWRERRGFVYEVPSLEVLHSFDYTTTAPAHQGWGITYDPNNHELIVSDGSEYLYFWDVENFETQRKVAVTRFDGRPQTQINELEFMDGLVCYNIWHDDDIICADPETGKSVREYDFSQLWPSKLRGSSENVLNGIALGKDHVLITGKRWDRIYKVDFTDWPTLFDNK